MQHCKIKEKFSKTNTVSISAPGSIEKASEPSPLPGLDVGGEVEVVGFDFAELTKAESAFFWKILAVTLATVAVVPSIIAPAAKTPILAVGESPLDLAILPPAFKPAATAAPVPTLVNPLATKSGTLKIELLILRVLLLSPLTFTSALGKSLP